MHRAFARGLVVPFPGSVLVPLCTTRTTLHPRASHAALYRYGRWRDGSAMVGRRFIGDYGGIMKASTIICLALAITISGCSDAAEDNQARNDMMQAAAENNQAHNDMMQAKNAYTKCLQENSAEPQKCAGFKEAYEVDLQAYRAPSGGSVIGNMVNFGPVNSNQPSKPSN